RDTDPPIVSAALARRLGSSAVLRTDVGRLPIAGAPTTAALDGFNRGRVALFPLPVAQRLFARVGRLDALYIVPDPGADLGALRDRVRTVVGPWNAVLSRADPPPGLDQVANSFLPMFGLLALVALGIGGVL